MLLIVVNLSPQVRGGMGLDFIEADPQYLQANASLDGKLIAKALRLAVENGYFPRTGNELKVIADTGGEIQKISLGGQELILN